MSRIRCAAVLTGLLWALLGVRTWEWDLQLDKRARNIQDNDPLLAPLVEAHAEMSKRWWTKKWTKISSNACVLFLAPGLFSILHMIMLSVLASNLPSPWYW